MPACADHTLSATPGASARGIRCYHCGRRFHVASKALSASCSHCYRQVGVADVTVKMLHWGGTLQSCGTILIQRKARAITKLAIASEGVTVLGELTGYIVSGGPVIIGPEAVLRAGVRAPRIIIEPGAVIDGGPFQIPDDPLGQIDLEHAARLGSASTRRDVLARGA